MSNLQIQVGKTYVSRGGEEVKIVKHNADYEFLFLGSNSLDYKATGAYLIDVESVHDLVSEVPTAPSLTSVSEPEKHKHYDLIMQWAANPALEIEYRQDESEEWIPALRPTWSPSYQYRIKPQD